MIAHTPERQRWVRLLLGASAHEPEHADPATFRDEQGHRRATDPDLLAHAQGLPPLTTAPPAEPVELDRRLWRCVHEPRAFDPRWLRPAGSLTDQPVDLVIETWTERELSALHALRTIARLRADATLAARCMDAAGWHVAELQPDNATNHPWAVHVFIELALDPQADSAARAGADLHAQTLLHNCRVRLGRADRLSAWVLRHAARELAAESYT